MTSAADLLSDLQSRSIRLEAKGDRLVVDGPKRLLTDQLLAELREHKPELLAYLRTREPSGHPSTVNVPSDSGSGSYRVTIHPSGTVSCTCPASQYRPGHLCKHARRALEQQRTSSQAGWTEEEQSLIKWFKQNSDDLHDGSRQQRINIAELSLLIRRGPGAASRGELIGKLCRLQADPAAYHQDLARQHHARLSRWSRR